MQRIIGESSTLADTLDHVSRVASLNRPILIVGERGSGKEMIAERLHYLSPRWGEVFQKLNCAAMNEELLDSELFGHETGAFTGATKTHIGRFERAEGGTLFLDELGTMASRTQEKLLRVIEYGEFERLGGQTTISVDVRIVAATNANLPQLAYEGKFRHDLLDRLAFDVIHTPPLRERLDDLQALTDHFANKMCSELEYAFFPGFTDSAMHALQQYSWPGNIRELKNTVERSICHWQDKNEPIDNVIIDPFNAIYSSASPAVTNTPANKALETIAKSEPQPTLQAPFAETVKTFEVSLIKEALLHCNYHQKNTAIHMGMSYHQLRALLKKYKTELSDNNAAIG